MSNLVDKAIGYFSPERAVKRAHARKVLGYYEAGRRDVQRKQRRESGSGTSAVLAAGTSLREQARHLDQNHDLAKGALNTLVQNIVGPNGIQVEPQPRTVTGEIHDDFAKQISLFWENFCLRPEVTHQHDYASAQRLGCRTWLRDGEVLKQKLSGNIPTLVHGTHVPYSIELIEPDLLPMDMNSLGKPRIIAGIEINDWNRPIGYHLYKQHPNENFWLSRNSGKKRVSADNIDHVKLIERIGQLRGVSIFASVMHRLDDIKDYEESERIAAKVAASMAAYIKKGVPDQYDDDVAGDPRDMRFRPGMIFDDLLPGEDIGTIDSNRPNPQLEPHRNGQLRAASAGLSLTYSALSRDYNGTYSAQRQELVEGYGAYGVLASEFIGQFVRPDYMQFLVMAIASGKLTIPPEVDRLSLADAFYQPPQMPWIDIYKEAKAWGELDKNGHASGIEIIRKRGYSPRDVAAQQKRWQKMKGETNSETDVEATGWHTATIGDT